MNEQNSVYDSPSGADANERSTARHAASAGLGIASVIATIVAVAERGGLWSTILAIAFAASVVSLIWVWEKNKKRLLGKWSAPLLTVALITGAGFVYAISDGTGTGPSDPTPTPDTTLHLEPPTRVSARAIDDSQIELTWQDNSDGEEIYVVYDYYQGAIEEVEADTESHIVTSLHPDTEYCLWIVAARGGAESEPSNLGCAVTASAPGSPTISEDAEQALDLVVEGRFGEPNPLFAASSYVDDIYSVTFEQDVLQIRSSVSHTNASKPTLWLATTEVPSDVVVVVEARTPPDTDGGTFLIVGCRWTEGQEQPEVSGYQLEIDTEFQQAGLARFDDGVRTDLVEWQQSDTIERIGDWNEIQLLCQDNTISVWINEAFIFSVEDDGHQAGGVALGAGRFADREVGDVSADFRNFAVWEQ